MRLLPAVARRARHRDRPRNLITGAVIDKNARIGKGVRIEPFPRGTGMDEESWSVREGIVVVPRSAVIPAGTAIAPGET
jgi:glucose-1-phosphate adenylyltransferase